MVNATLTGGPVFTVTGREAPPLTEQLDWIPLRVTVWLPVTRFWKVTESFVPVALLPPPVTVPVYRFESGVPPDVLVVTGTLPVSLVHAIVNVAVAAPPGAAVGVV